MHPALDPANVANLPTQLRSIAENVLAGSESIPAFRKLGSMLPVLPPSQAVHTLPCIFANLDSSRIPSVSELDSLLDGSRLSVVELGLHAATALAYFAKSSMIPADACPLIWSHLWMWMQFLFEYWEFLPANRVVNGGFTTTTEFSRLQVLNIAKLCEHPPTMNMIRSTPGVPRILAMAWISTITNTHGYPERQVAEVCDIVLMLPPGPSTPAVFDEIVDGVGGSVDDLAGTCAIHFARAAAYPRSDHIGRFLIAGLTFYGGAADPQPMRVAFRENSVAYSLTCAMLAVDHTAFKAELAFCLNHLTDMMEWSPGYPFVAQAIKAGLLRVIVKFVDSAKVGNRGDLPPSLIKILTEILPRAMVHYSVLRALREKVGDAKQYASAFKINKSLLKAEWKDFVVLAETRLRFYDTWKGARSSPLACDNLKCQTIRPRREFRCCGLCRTTNYCSAVCQSADWHTNHRESCGIFRQYKLESPDPFPVRDKSFLHALLTSEFLRLLPSIFIRQVIFMHTYPEEPFYTSWTYSDAHDPKIDVSAQRMVTTNSNDNYSYTRMVERARGGWRCMWCTYISGRR
ncbi:hypothetical protein R3P38DRAFT_2664070 [Favolaschia claudopus]|uniref:MYND-type domain-containing protein n=1 Tax=Favolaschia claudopus TaxID=2862362 RepID=A0AAV9ZGY3_9AGAR